MKPTRNPQPATLNLCLALLLAALATVQADTIITGGNVSGTWTAANSPYIVQSNITVAPNTQLTIEPAVVVRFQTGTGLEIWGSLVAEGTPTNEILFTSDNVVKAPGDWEGLRSLATEDWVPQIKLRYCRVEYATDGLSGRSQPYRGTAWMLVTIENTVVQLCSGTGVALTAAGSSYWSSSPGWINLSLAESSICSNELSGVECTAFVGFSSGGAFPDSIIRNNTVFKNGGNGIATRRATYNRLPEISNNVIWDNAASGISIGGWISTPIRNNIVVSNATGIAADGLMGVPSFTFNDVWANGTNWAGDAVAYASSEGNISLDPLCANPNARDFHLRSQAGRYDPATDSWVLDAVTSPCIDAGDPASAWANEPVPNRGRINMGAFGNTPFASKSLPLTVVINRDDSGPGSLRQAIADAAPGDTIDFAVTGTITLTSGELVITNDLTIAGPGATNLTVSGNNASRIFAITGGTVHLAGLTVANGYAPGYGDNGGGIYNSTSLTISNCSIVNNHAGSNGGGVFNQGNVLVQNTRISNNSAGFDGGGVSGYGSCVLVGSMINNNGATFYGGGCFFRWATFSITNVTISGNSGTGGLWCRDSVGNISSSTIAANRGGIASLFINTLNLHNTIVAGNSGYDCQGPLSSLDYNFIQNTNGATITNLTTHNLYGQDPKLGPLADNGGPTPTHALRFDSPAINAGNSGGLTTDQRGFPRPIGTPIVEGGDGSDIGAYEADPNLRLAMPEVVGSDIRLRFNTLFGKTYAVESKDNVTDAWSPLCNNVPGTGGALQPVDAGAATLPHRFYRAVQLPQ